MQSIFSFIFMIYGMLSNTFNSIYKPSFNTPIVDQRAITFDQWMIKYQKSYPTEEEKIYRMNIFMKNFDYIQNINNNASLTYKLGANKFADLTNEEFRAIYIRGSIESKSKYTKAINMDNHILENIPSSIDWRNNSNNDYVGPVNNQGQCGGATIYSSVGAVESAYAIKNNVIPPALSFTQMENCIQPGSGCTGSTVSIDQVYQYIEKDGIALQSKYTGCKSTPFLKLSGYTDITPNNSTALAIATAQQPVAVYIEASSSVFQFYTGGIINDPNCGDEVDHSVLVVGYGTQNNQDYWIVQNSWGSSWGEEGYALIAKTSVKGPGMCGIATAPSYPNLQ